MTPLLLLHIDAQLVAGSAAGTVLIQHQHGHRSGPQHIYKRTLQDFGPAQSHTASRLMALLWCLQFCIRELDTWELPTYIFTVRVITHSKPFAATLLPAPDSLPPKPDLVSHLNRVHEAVKRFRELEAVVEE